MAAFDLEEQEQISSIKAWWNQYGNLVTGGLLAVAVGMAAYQGWNWYQRTESLAASATYGRLEKAVVAKDVKSVKEAAGELLEKHGSTAYAGMGALVSAKVLFDSGDVKSAHAQLAWAKDHAQDEEIKDLARLRLAHVMLDEKLQEDALKLLEKDPVPALASRFLDLKGDILVLQGKPELAVKAYQDALARVDADFPVKSVDRQPLMKQMLQVKLESLGVGQ